jgi:hypothetical protein
MEIVQNLFKHNSYISHTNIVKDTKIHKNKCYMKGLNLIFKQWTGREYVIQKQKHNN